MSEYIKIFILTFLILTAIIQTVHTSSGADLIDFQDRWALLVGVGQYPSESGINTLTSPANDVKEMQQMLIQYGGFLKEHIIDLSESRAKCDGVRDAFQKLENQVKPEDLIVFYFSGRGSRVADDVFPDSEKDTLDECLLLYDTVLENGMPIDKYIRDDEIGKHLSRLGAKQSVVIIDACYQGNNIDEKGVTVSSKTNGSGVYDGMSGDFLPPGIIVLEACAHDKTTFDGEFTSFLKKIPELFKDPDGIIDLNTLHIYAKSHLSYLAPRLFDPKSRAARVSLIHPFLKVISQPTGATISVDGKKCGATPTECLILPTGQRKLEVCKRGYRVWDNLGRLIDIKKPGRIQKPIDIKLTPVQVTGEVRFRNSNLPIKGATVTIVGAKNIPPTTTDKEGQFVFNDWSQNDLPESDEYEILISDESGRFGRKKLPLKVPGDFTTDYSLGTITVDRHITVTITVTNVVENFPMPNALVKLDQEQIPNDNQDGIFENTITNPPNSVMLQVSKDGYETIYGDEIHKETITIASENHKYIQQVQLTPALNTYSAEVTTQSQKPVAGVIVILNGEQLGQATNSNGTSEGQRRIAPDKSMSLQVQKGESELFNDYIRPEKSEYRRYRLPIQVTLPIPPPEVELLMTVEDQGKKPIQGMVVMVNGKNYGKTKSTGTIDIRGRITIVNNEPPNFEFEKYGRTYKPQKTEFEGVGTNSYTVLVTLQIPYGKIEMVAETEVEGQNVNLYVNAEVSLDKETQIQRLPATIPVFPGTHQLRILIGGIPLYSKPLKIGKNETVPVNLMLTLSDAWRVCLLTLKEVSNEVQILESAERIAKALDREYLAQTFYQRRERLPK